VVNATDLARTVYNGIPDDVILLISFSASAAGRAELSFWEEPTTKWLLLKQKVQRLGMSDLSYEHELGEVGEGGEVDEGPLQHCWKLTT
jgi:hypothetical protein